jgi:hypothetical protein
MLTAERRVSLLIAEVRQSRQFDPNGHYIGRCEMIMGLLYKAKRKPVLAVSLLTHSNGDRFTFWRRRAEIARKQVSVLAEVGRLSRHRR